MSGPLLWLSLTGLPAAAQDAEPQQRAAPRGLSISTSFTATTEVSRVSNGGTISGAPVRNEGTDWVTQAGPGLQVISRSGRVQGILDAALLGTVYARHSELNTVSGSLALNGRAEVVPGWAFVDATASISRQNTSPFGLQSAAGSSLRSTADRRDVANVSLSPYLSGVLGGWADYELRYTAQAVRVRGGSEDDSDNQTLSATLRSRPGTVLGWSLLGSTQRVSYAVGRATTLDRGVGSLIWRPDVDLQFSLRGGVERTDVGLSDTESYATGGVGVRWTPTPRTTLAADVDRRYFGTGYQLLAEHRWRRLALRVSTVRDTTGGTGATGVGRPITLQQLYMLQYASAEPDPLLRELRVRELLRLTNQNGGTLVNAGFGIGAVSLQRRSDAALSFTGARTTATVQAFTTTSDALDRVSPALRDGVGRLRQQGAAVSASHRLTPQTNVTLAASHARNRDAQAVATTTGSTVAGSTTSAVLALNTSLNPRTTGSLGVRHTRDRGVVSAGSTRETALSASVNVRF